MRYSLILLALFATLLEAQFDNPAKSSRMYWEKDILSMKFSMRSQVEISQTGDSFEEILDLKYRTKKFRDETLQKLSSGTLSTNDISPAFKFLASLDDVKIDRNTGLTTRLSTDSYASIQGIFLPRDALTVSFHSTAIQSVAAELDFDSLFGFRVYSGSYWDWLTDLKTINLMVGSRLPTTDAGIKMMGELEAAGYPPEIAGTMSSLAEDEGINPDRLSGKLFLDLMRNTLNEYGASLADGADPLKYNRSLGHTNRIWYQSFDIGYSAGISDWFTAGATIKYMRGGFSKRQDLLRRYSGDKGTNYFLHAVGQSFAPTNYKSTLGLDLGLIFSPPQDALHNLAIGVWGKNINQPSFKWNHGSFTLPPQFAAGLDWTFHRELPIRFHYQMDLHRTESLVLKDYHSQMVRFGLEFEPNYPTFGILADIGLAKNVGDGGEPWLAKLELGLQFWYFRIFAGVETNFKLIRLPGLSMPTRFLGEVRIDLSIPIG